MKFLIFLFFVIITGCNPRQQVVEEPNVYYTCSMHPEVMEKLPGRCPICGMALIKVIITKDETNAIRLGKTQSELANIRVDTVKVRPISEELVLTGTLTVNENNISVISSRINGRIDKLFFRNNGDQIHFGDTLYLIYSEELLAAEKEYLLALTEEKTDRENQTNFRQFADAARNRLMLLGLNETQLNELETSRRVKNTVPLISRSMGYILEFNIREGDYVNDGQTLFKIGDNSTLWVEGQLFPGELSYVSMDKEVDIIIPAYPEDKVTGKIDFISQEMNPNSSVIQIRAELNNTKNRYIPGMLAEIRLKKQQKMTLVVPLDAVIQGSDMSFVWTEDKNGYFRCRKVVLGIRNPDNVEILEGLNENELVVISGAYLLNSEYIFKKGANPMAGMKM
jgi:Cu(I)/Ag(I) efflux system membrane fusion protein